MSALAESRTAPATRWTTVELDGERYAIHAARVREVLAPCGVTPVPGAPTHVRGVKEAGGALLTVVDLRALLGLEPRAADTRSRIVVAEAGAVTLGLLVDGVGAVIDIDAAQVEPLPPGGRGTERIVHGLCSQGEQLLVLLDLDALTDPQVEPDGGCP